MINRIKLTRIEKNYGSARKLATAVGISAAVLSGYERNRHNPPIDILIRIARELDISIEGLYADK